MDLKTASLIVSKYTAKKTKTGYAIENIYCRVVDGNGAMHLVATDGYRLVICHVENPYTTGLSVGDAFLLPPTKKGYVAFRKDSQGIVSGEDSQGKVWSQSDGLSRYPSYRDVIPKGTDLSRTPPDGFTIRPERLLDVWEDLRRPFYVLALERETMKILAIVLTLIIGSVAYAETPNDMRHFFDALRQVETGGHPNEGRDAVGDGGRSIGPYQIQRAYWQDSRVTGEYEDVRDREYAERVMLAYWKRYVPKALESRDWETLARCHNGGPRGHKRESTIRYWNRVKRQMNK